MLACVVPKVRLWWCERWERRFYRCSAGMDWAMIELYWAFPQQLHDSGFTASWGLQSVQIRSFWSEFHQLRLPKTLEAWTQPPIGSWKSHVMGTEHENVCCMYFFNRWVLFPVESVRSRKARRFWISRAWRFFAATRPWKAGSWVDPP